jgi:hypothetical protein
VWNVYKWTGSEYEIDHYGYCGPVHYEYCEGKYHIIEKLPLEQSFRLAIKNDSNMYGDLYDGENLLSSPDDPGVPAHGSVWGKFRGENWYVVETHEAHLMFVKAANIEPRGK